MSTKLSPPFFLKMCAFSTAISSSVSRQSAAKPGVTTARLRTPFREALHRRVGVGLEPFGAAEARLEGQAQLVVVEFQPLAQEPRGLDALAVIGIALVDIGLGHAVVGGEDDVGLERQARQLGLQRVGEGLDIDRVVEPGRRDAQRRLAAHLHQRAERLVAHRRGGGGGVLRIERDEQNAVAAAAGSAASRDAIEGWP